MCAFAALVACTSLNAQDKSDFGGWYSVTAVKPIDKAVVSLRLEQRLNDDMGNNECRFAALTGGYRFNDWLLGELSYEFWDIAGGNYNHKAVGALTGTLKEGGLAVAIREKYELNVPDDGGDCSHTLRSRLRVQYRIPDSRITPYVMEEVFTWNDVWIRSLNYIGLEWAAGDHSTFDFFYNYHLPNGSIPVHTIGVGYVVKF